MSTDATSLERVARWLVTSANPPRDVYGMDSERCAALHNAIFEHAWTSSGRNADDFYRESQTWFEYYPAAPEDRFHPSLQAFLREARVLPEGLDQPNFFYNVASLHAPRDDTMWMNRCYDQDDPNRILSLYTTYMALATQLDGLVCAPYQSTDSSDD